LEAAARTRAYLLDGCHVSQSGMPKPGTALQRRCQLLEALLTLAQSAAVRAHAQAVAGSRHTESNLRV
jgi:hypothetical protein